MTPTDRPRTHPDGLPAADAVRPIAAPTRYRLEVAGHLAQHWEPWFGTMTLEREPDGTTSLTGVVADQAELHGLLAKVRDLGLTLLALSVVDPPPAADAPRTSLAR